MELVPEEPEEACRASRRFTQSLRDSQAVATILRALTLRSIIRVDQTRLEEASRGALILDGLEGARAGAGLAPVSRLAVQMAKTAEYARLARARHLSVACREARLTGMDAQVSSAVAVALRQRLEQRREQRAQVKSAIRGYENRARELEEVAAGKTDGAAAAIGLASLAAPKHPIFLREEARQARECAALLQQYVDELPGRGAPKGPQVMLIEGVAKALPSRDPHACAQLASDLARDLLGRPVQKLALAASTIEALRNRTRFPK